MRELRSYVVRIYRQGARSLTGVVEDTSSGVQRPFGSAEQLWALLRQRQLRPVRAKVSRTGHPAGDDPTDPNDVD